MTKILIGLAVGLLIGAGCRYFNVPVPSPPSLVGALLVVAMTVGYLAADHFLNDSRKAVGERQNARSVETQKL